MRTEGKTMDYWIFSLSSCEHESSGEAHVFTRAYRAAWRVRYGSEPTGAHQVAALDLVMHFGKLAPTLVGVSHGGAESIERRVEPAATVVDVPLESDMTTDLWTRLRRRIGNRIPSGELAQILADLRAEEQPGISGSGHGRERLDLMKGWVPDNPEHPSNDVNPEREVRLPEHGRTRAR